MGQCDQGVTVDHTSSMIRSLEAALAVLGTEDSDAKQELEAAARRGKAETATKSVQNPDTVINEVRSRVIRVWMTLETLDGRNGPEVDGLKHVLAKQRDQFWNCC